MNQQKAKKDNVINTDISNPKIILVDQNNVEITLPEALKMARESNLDLVMFRDLGEKAICKILDYKKYKFQKDKLVKNNKSNSVIKKKAKCIKVRVNVSRSDLSLKIKNVKRLLMERYPVDLIISWKGNEPELQARKNLILKTAQEQLLECGIIRDMPNSKSPYNLLIHVKPNIKYVLSNAKNKNTQEFKQKVQAK